MTTRRLEWTIQDAERSTDLPSGNLLPVSLALARAAISPDGPTTGIA